MSCATHQALAFFHKVSAFIFLAMPGSFLCERHLPSSPPCVCRRRPQRSGTRTSCRATARRALARRCPSHRLSSHWELGPSPLLPLLKETSPDLKSQSRAAFGQHTLELFSLLHDSGIPRRHLPDVPAVGFQTHDIAANPCRRHHTEVPDDWAHRAAAKKVRHPHEVPVDTVSVFRHFP